MVGSTCAATHDRGSRGLKGKVKHCLAVVLDGVNGWGFPVDSRVATFAHIQAGVKPLTSSTSGESPAPETYPVVMRMGKRMLWSL